MEQLKQTPPRLCGELISAGKRSQVPPQPFVYRMKAKLRAGVKDGAFVMSLAQPTAAPPPLDSIHLWCFTAQSLLEVTEPISHRAGKRAGGRKASNADISFFYGALELLRGDSLGRCLLRIELAAPGRPRPAAPRRLVDEKQRKFMRRAQNKTT